MRKLGPAAVAALSLILLTSCTSKKVHMDPASMRVFATRYTAAWSGQDPARVAGFFAEGGSLSVNDAEPAVGRAAITEVARGFMTALPDLVLAMDSLEVHGSHAVYGWTLTGTNTGPGGTGNRVHISGYEDWAIGPDGLIAESQGHFDEAEYRQQLRGE